MKKKVKERLKRGFALLMAAAAVFSMRPSPPMKAASEQATITFENCLDGAGNAIRYQQSVSHNGHNCGDAGEVRTRIYADGEPAFCIQPGVSLHSGNTLQANASDTWNALSGSQKNAVNLVLLYGSQGSMATLPGSEDEKVVATQILIWEIVTGCRGADAPYALVDGKFYEAFCAGGANAGVSAAYQQIIENMAGHGTIPSFASEGEDGESKQMEWDGSQYILKLTDSNGVLSQFAFTSPDSNVKVSVSGNTLTLTSKNAIKDSVLLSAVKTGPAVSSEARLVAYGDPSLQDIVIGVENAADVAAYLKVEAAYGELKLIKTSEDGIVEGLKFQITGKGIDKTIKTGKGGVIKVENLSPGTYTVTELTEGRYETQKAKKVTVKGGETAKVEFANTLKRGSLKVIKSSEDHFVERMKFHLYGKSLSGADVDEYAVTNKNGTAIFKDILISGSKPYTLEEVDTAARYVVPEKQQTAIQWKEVTKATMTNVLKKFRVKVTKVDKETGKPQGDATLAGAVYGIYDGDTLVNTYTTDGQGQFTTNYYPCGEHWSIREISPSEGYLLDETIYPVGAAPGEFTVERNSLQTEVKEQSIKGKISILKHTDDGSTQVETPEEGAQFQVYLKSSGSFEAAGESERDTLVCDAYGYAKTKDLPYGTYTIHQTKGWEGSEKIADFDVYVNSDGKVYHYLMNNAPFQSYIKVVKKDAETGKTIPLSGAGYQIYDGEGELVTMKCTYPEPADMDTFYTASNGSLVTPQSLPCGDYTLVEGYNYGNGYIKWAKNNYGGYTAAGAVEFSEMMAKKMGWKSYGDKQYVPHVLQYYAFGRIPAGTGNQAIVQVALTQEGNSGDTYWSWYGFGSRVEWCACFVSWCGEQCGYLESGVLPKFSLCSDGAKWFQTKGQFQDGSYVPAAGDIIFFDWKTDGTIDHVGIVENVADGVVHTVEGNSKDKVARRSYPLGDSRIYGYGITKFENK